MEFGNDVIVEGTTLACYVFLLRIPGMMLGSDSLTGKLNPQVKREC